MFTHFCGGAEEPSRLAGPVGQLWLFRQSFVEKIGCKVESLLKISSSHPKPSIFIYCIVFLYFVYIKLSIINDCTYVMWSSEAVNSETIFLSLENFRLGHTTHLDFSSNRVCFMAGGESVSPLLYMHYFLWFCRPPRMIFSQSFDCTRSICHSDCCAIDTHVCKCVRVCLSWQNNQVENIKLELQYFDGGEMG